VPPVGKDAVSRADLWALRALGYAQTRKGPTPRALDTAWSQALGLTGRRAEGLDDAEVQKALRKRLSKANAAAEEGRLGARSIPEENVGRLASELELDPIARELLGFAVTAHTHPLLQEALFHLATPPIATAHEFLAEVLGQEVGAIQTALRRDGLLHKTGLLRLAECRQCNHREPLQLAYGLDQLLSRVHSDAASLLDTFFRSARPASLERDDFEHLGVDLEILLGLLRAPRKRTGDDAPRGVNVLLYGAPGTGKTELARVLAKEVGAKLFEVLAEDEDGEPIYSQRRLSGCALAQRMLARKTDALLVFDEIEDAFPRAGRRAGDEADSGMDKGWTVRLLEETAVHTVWIGNHIEQIDPAFLRRFDFAVELRTPPLAARRRILDRHTHGLPLREPWLRELARDDRVAPAQVERAARVTRMLACDDASAAEATFARVLESGLAMGRGVRKTAPRSNGVRFDASLLRASEDLEAVVRGLGATRTGALCLYGPPGTGKTAFAHHLAERLGMPILVRRASDLLGPFVGETEANLREMFEQATREHALLLIDEADSFFRDRGRASQSWEITQVNELLVQMECFEGPFVCTTNLVNELDEASLRRFTLKIRFDPLDVEQRRRMFDATLRCLAPASGDLVSSSTRSALDRLDRLTPGDFAVASRKLTLLGGDVTERALLEALRGESEAKQRGHRPLGFSA
jgi:transitional endoplasmic reticulum ATPase